MLEIKNTAAVVVLIFLKDNSPCGQAVSSSKLCSQSIPYMCDAFAWTLCAQS